jgi:hypothetical protein
MTVDGSHNTQRTPALAGDRNVSNDRIKVRVAVVAGHYIGVSASDRWNMAWIGLDDMPADRNQTAIKRARRANPDLDIIVVRNVQPIATTTPEEHSSLFSASAPWNALTASIVVLFHRSPVHAS